MDAGAYAEASAKIELHHWNLDPLTYERGYRMGYLTIPTVTGYIIKTLEGGLQLGFNSSESHEPDKFCLEDEVARVRGLGTPEDRIDSYANLKNNCPIIDNPWLFSTPDTSFKDVLQKAKDQPILIYYIGYRVVLWTKTYEIVQKAWPIDGTAPVPPKSFSDIYRYPISRWKWLHYGDGTISGRVVRISIEGTVRESYETTIQVGVSGNNFVEMSLTGSDMFDYIVKCMATGRPLQIHFFRLYQPEEWSGDLLKNHRTNFRIYQVDLLDK
jgi:hypothetical protein